MRMRFIHRNLYSYNQIILLNFGANESLYPEYNMRDGKRFHVTLSQSNTI